MLKTEQVLPKAAGMFSPGRTLEILLVDDDDNSFEVLRVCFGDTQLAHHLSRVTNGDEAIQFLRTVGPYTKVPRPDLIVLDLHMPRKDGREFLKEVKTDHLLRRIPVCVLTSSGDQNDINSLYDLHANCYLRKPKELRELCRQIRLIEEFWFGVVLLPTTEEVNVANAKTVR